MIRPSTDPQVHVETRTAWREWLGTHHARETGAWAVTWRKATGRSAPAYDELVEEALCVGWVDSIQRKLDDERTMLRFSPRKARSGWARPNKQRVERLLAAGLVLPAGHAAIDRAKADGSWSLLDDVEDLVVPDDLATALASAPPAAGSSPRSPARRSAASWSGSCRPSGRRPAPRVAETAELARRGQRANQWPPPGNR